MSETKTQVGPTAETTLGQDLRALLRHWLGGRRGLWMSVAVVAGAGLWLGWPALTAAGLAPLLIGVLPCAAMCALGLCMKGGGQSCDSRKGDGDVPPVPPSQRKEIE